MASSFLFRIHPFARHLFAQPFETASTTYLESLKTEILHRSFRASRPLMTDMSSIRLFVVRLYPPEISFRWVP